MATPSQRTSDPTTQVLLLEKGLETLAARMTRLEEQVQDISNEQHTFYRNSWPQAQAAFQGAATLKDEVSGLRDELRTLQLTLYSNNAAMAQVKLDVDKLATTFRDVAQRTQDDLNGVKKFVWMMTGGLMFISVAAQFIVKLLH